MKLPFHRAPDAFEAGYAAIRDELGVPADFPTDVLAEAEAAHIDSGLDAPTDRLDARHLRFVAIDPPGATDLDQAFFAEHRGTGFRVYYAIADVASFVRPGGAIDTEARARGTTLYSPDRRTPLHPPVLSEDRGSLLAGGERPALLWTIDLDTDGAARSSHLQRATVSIREAISYAEAQRRIDNGDELTGMLRRIGTLRQEQEAARGGVSLNVPAQEVTETADGYDLVYDRSLPVEGWNAQISLLTGMEAGKVMADAGVGILRTLPPMENDDLAQLRRQAGVLGVDWPTDVSYPDLVRGLTADTPQHAAFLLQAARAFRGAGYLALGAETEARPHSAIASLYAHLTAPLRRLVDRFGNEILLALHADRQPPAWASEALEELPSHMGRARSRESSLERAIVDFTEAKLLEPAVGAVFRGVVVDLDEPRDRATIQLADPAIVAHIPAAGRRLAEELDVRLDAADPTTRSITLTPVNAVR